MQNILESTTVSDVLRIKIVRSKQYLKKLFFRS